MHSSVLTREYATARQPNSNANTNRIEGRDAQVTPSGQTNIPDRHFRPSFQTNLSYSYLSYSYPTFKPSFQTASCSQREPVLQLEPFSRLKPF